eukprot:6487985-Amphidinium_carterae.8
MVCEVLGGLDTAQSVKWGSGCADTWYMRMVKNLSMLGPRQHKQMWYDAPRSTIVAQATIASKEDHVVCIVGETILMLMMMLVNVIVESDWDQMDRLALCPRVLLSPSVIPMWLWAKMTVKVVRVGAKFLLCSAERSIFWFLVNAQAVCGWSGLASVGNHSSAKMQRRRDGSAAAACISGWYGGR